MSTSLWYDTLYRSNEQFHVRYVNGERKEESYYLYYYFRQDGIWLSKTTDDPYLDIEGFMDDLDLAKIRFDPHHDEPMDRRQELLYQSGTFDERDDSVFLTWKHSLLEEKQRRWYFRIRGNGMLETDFGEIQLLPLD